MFNNLIKLRKYILSFIPEKVKDQRLLDSVLFALDQGDGVMMVLEAETNDPAYFSRHLMCPSTGLSS